MVPISASEGYGSHQLAAIGRLRVGLAQCASGDKLIHGKALRKDVRTFIRFGNVAQMYVTLAAGRKDIVHIMPEQVYCNLLSLM